MTYRKQIDALNAQIKSLQNQVKTIQEKCAHKNVTEKHGGNTGNYDESNNIYWTDYSCPNCYKTWTKYSK